MIETADNYMDAKHCILIVDDEESTRQLIGTLLEGEFELLYAHSGESCFDQIEKRIPDLILLDIMLPDTSGIDICREIRLQERLADTPVILVTVKSEERDVQAGLEAGAVDYIKKPVRHLELTARVKSALKLSGLVKQMRLADQEKQRLIDNLEMALKQVKELSGLLPICSVCKNVRDDNGYWQQIEDYIGAHSEANFSHSLCPNCAETIYGTESWFPPKK
ncbi:MAG: response regulator [Deltaproteobacteria bacterium]|nr:response regulator [Deltaproteobacteria bacterium]MBN2671206.1 response regulator [Deltaproteobacteria bacterium]